METKEARALLDQIRKIRYPSAFASDKPKKGKNESYKDFVLRSAKYTCIYCKQKFPRHKLCMITLHPDQDNLPKLKNKACACSKHAAEKGAMSHAEYKRLFHVQKKKTRNSILKSVKLEVLRAYDYKCIYCEFIQGFTPKDAKLTVDHKIPIDRGGTNEFKNLCCCCMPHNLRKDTMTADEYFKKLSEIKHARLKRAQNQ